ncbi:YceI family protein [Flavobacterium sp. '19STA2R22 D10 B1']|uniref:YceI family protein n=1 Tax=Flavobacterium aerium TaxID=3037261 RepID=UPI00278C8428|nr:YceI family protein [Flavobacterium sp. '19STA2R22 D10 B1']
MKNFKTIAIALVVALGTLTASAQNGTKKVDASKSKITWVGKKVTGSHEGTVNLKEGSLIFKKDVLAGGNFTIDMTTISSTDLTGEYKGKLDGHLKADDFFGTDKFPTAKLVFKKIATKSKGNYTVTADLTIKGITKPVTFDIATTATTATSSFKINRTVYGIKYNSGSFFDSLGDKTINDDFDVTVALQF